MRNRKKYFKINIYLDNTILQLFILHGVFFWFFLFKVLVFNCNYPDVYSE